MLRLKYIIPLMLFISLIIFLWQGLQFDPKNLPSPLLNKKLPEFVLKDLINPKVNLTNQDFVGQVALLNVWASWCVSCQAEQPFLMDLARKNILSIFAVNYKDEVNAANQWLQQHGNPYTKIGFDPTGLVSVNFGVYGTPETFLIDNQGVVRYKIIGELTPQIWEKKLAPLIAELQKKGTT